MRNRDLFDEAVIFFSTIFTAYVLATAVIASRGADIMGGVVVGGIVTLVRVIVSLSKKRTFWIRSSEKFDG